MGKTRTATVAGGPTATVAVLVFPIGRLVLVLGLDQVGGVEERALFRPDVDECGLDPRQDGLDRAEVDVAHHAAGVGTIHQELNKAVVLQDRDAGFACGPADENFPFQSMCPRSRSANSRSGSYDCSSKNSFRADRRRMSGTDRTGRRRAAAYAKSNACSKSKWA